ncbi:MAG: AraC family transcriptional regulator [Prolixibacteraceae bacterium]|jgi:AraC-like DNA-binding protein
MKKWEETDILKYFASTNSEENWGITTTTAGFESMKTRDDDPILAMHPAIYRFKSDQGRILNEYQLIYITEGRGVFKSSSYDTTQINAGTMFLLFPGEWHSYYPDPKAGWKSYWIGFTGPIIEKRVASGHFSKKECICNIGINEIIINLYKEVIHVASDNLVGSEYYISSIAQHILGFFYYKNLNHIENSNTKIIDKLNKARSIMRDNLINDISFDDLAKELGVSYSWFRRMFRKYEGTSPAQYLIQLKIIRIKELLTTSDLSISEIAYQTGLESKSQLSTFFKKYEGKSPSEFRKTNQ